jgi:hypothetical protein
VRERREREKEEKRKKMNRKEKGLIIFWKREKRKGALFFYEGRGIIFLWAPWPSPYFLKVSKF